MQLLSCQFLYDRGLIYHKTARVWYKKDPNGAGYGIIACKEKFELSSWSFVPCAETLMLTDVLTAGEVNEFIKKLSR